MMAQIYSDFVTINIASSLGYVAASLVAFTCILEVQKEYVKVATDSFPSFVSALGSCTSLLMLVLIL